MAFVIPPGIILPVFILRVISPALVLVATISLLSLRPPSPRSPSPITSVVVANVVPRRASILSLLSLVSASYFLDGAAFVIFAVLDKFWPRHTGIEINTVAGVAAFAGLAALGSWKDVNGVSVWTLRRIRLVVTLALLLDIALVVLLGLKIRDIRNGDLFSFVPQSLFSKGDGHNQVPLVSQRPLLRFPYRSYFTSHSLRSGFCF